VRPPILPVFASQSETKLISHFKVPLRCSFADMYEPGQEKNGH